MLVYYEIKSNLLLKTNAPRSHRRTVSCPVDNILTCGAKLSVGITTHYEGNEILLGAQTLIGLRGLYFSEHVGCTHY